MATAFVRQLGQEPGVQLNPLRDNSEVPSIDNADQVFGIMMRATRGRIDKPFKVNRGNVRTKLGKGDQVRVNALNEAYVHVVEALNNGAYEAVVQRLVAADAAVKWAVVTVDAGTGAISYSVSATDPVAPYLFAVKHLECHNDGITIEYRADEKKVGGVTKANDVITVRLRDADGNLLYAFTGSLSPTALDDYGKSMYLPDVATSATDAVSIRVGVTGVSATVAPTSSAYGYDTAGGEKWSKSAVLACFEEGAAGRLCRFAGLCARRSAVGVRVVKHGLAGGQWRDFAVQVGERGGKQVHALLLPAASIWLARLGILGPAPARRWAAGEGIKPLRTSAPVARA